MRSKHLLLAAFCTLLLSRGAAAQEVDYLRDVKPLLAKHCIACHGPEKQRAGLRLDTGALARKGAKEGPVLAPGKSAQSKLIHAVTGTKDVAQMPPEDRPKLSAAEIALLKRWIDAGAASPAAEIAAVARNTHWAFQPLKRAALPEIRIPHSATRNGIDRFILAKLAQEKIAPSPEADRITLIRRLSLDLLGLPPTPEEVTAFVSDNRADAYEQLVDRLLTSPHYGERWARHWLDLARYADSNGFNIDAPRTIWPYRDWVIEALNKDMPFDRFVIEQLAGDLLPKATPEQIIATGFHRNTLTNQEGGIDLEQFRIESIVDRVNTTGAVFLGLTLGCAQCHDHKYDPISQKEYYQLFAFLNNADEPSLPLPTAAQTRQKQEVQARLDALQKTLAGLDTTSEEKRKQWERALTPDERRPLPDYVKLLLDTPEYQRSPEQKKQMTEVFRRMDEARQYTGNLAMLFHRGGVGIALAAEQAHLMSFRNHLEQRIAATKKEFPAIVSTMILKERKTPRTTHVHIKGDFLRKGDVVTPAVPAVLHRLPNEVQKPTRLDLAKWVVDPQNPLTARVFVNRLWQQYFGAGLVETENDFGTQGTPPTHPELLDWLASEFIAQGWSMKQLHKLLVTSATYRQTSKARPDLSVSDPRNRWLARQNRLRLEAELVRDVGLAASGLLVAKIGGPPVFPPQPDGVFRFTQVQRDWKADKGADRYRRGLYTHFWRSAPHPALIVFDAPESTQTCTRRNRSNTPLQALTLLNDAAFFEMAQALAERVLSAKLTSERARLSYAFQLCLARRPSPVEEARLQRLLGELRRALPSAEAKQIAGKLVERVPAFEAAAWVHVSRVLLNLDEFITRE